MEYSFKHNLDIECANYRTGQELLDKMEKLSAGQLKNKQTAEAVDKLRSEFDEMKAQLSTQDASKYRRPEATGATEKSNAQLADC